MHRLQNFISEYGKRRIYLIDIKLPYDVIEQCIQGIQKRHNLSRGKKEHIELVQDVS